MPEKHKGIFWILILENILFRKEKAMEGYEGLYGLMVLVGLIICFGGIYIRKIIAAVMGLIWGVTAAVLFLMYNSGGFLGIAFLLGSGDEESTGYIVLALIIIAAIIVTFVKFERLCAAINAFLTSFVLLLLFLLLCGFKAGALLVLLVLLLSCVAAYISYLYYTYGFILVTGFLGALIASTGVNGLMYNLEEGYSLIILGTLILGCAGSAFQIRKLKPADKEKTNTFQKIRDIIVFDSKRLKQELIQNRLLFLVPVIAFFVLPELQMSVYFLPAALSLGIFHQISVGVFLGGLIYSAAFHCVAFDLVYLFVSGVVSILHSYAWFAYNPYIETMNILTYVFLWVVLKILSARIVDRKKSLYIMAAAAFVWKTWVTVILLYFDVNNLNGIDLYDIVTALALMISVAYLYVSRVENSEGIQNAGKKRKAFIMAAAALFSVALMGIVIQNIQEWEYIGTEWEQLLHIDDEWDSQPDEESALQSEETESLPQYGKETLPQPGDSKKELNECISDFEEFLNGRWDGNLGNYLFFDAQNGELILTEEGETDSYSWNQIKFQHNVDDINRRNLEYFNREVDGTHTYHYWCMEMTGTDNIYEVYCDYAWDEMLWIYGVNDGGGFHQNYVEYFYKEGGNSSNDAGKDVDLEQIISEIRDICWGTDGALSSMEAYDAGNGITQYIDDMEKIRMITVQPGSYVDQDYSIRNSKVWYFYDTSGEHEKTCFVSIESENGDKYKFYLKDSVCYRYIDGDGAIHDYKNGTDPETISSYGDFCRKADEAVGEY